MKQINFFLNDEEHKRITRNKNKMSWREYILFLTQEVKK